MKRVMSWALGMLFCISAWGYENVPATFSWTVGNEAAATIVSDAADGVKETKVGVGAGLTVTTASNIAANPGVTMVLYNPASSKPGKVAGAMIEYTVKMKKGITFNVSNVSYDAVKKGTDNASYSWSYEIDGVAGDTVDVAKEDIVRDNNTTGSPALNHSHAITANGGQEMKFRFFVSGFDSGKNFCLSNIVITGTISGEEEVRAFQDFKIEFRDNPYTVFLPASGTLPTGVSVSGTSYNGGQHGVQGGTVVVPVDGPVKFTIGACQYSSTTINVKKDGVNFTTINNNAPCGEQKPNYNQFVTWTYNVEAAAELTFEFGSQTYVPYFFAEATDFVPQVEVRYYDTDGKTAIGIDTVDGGSALAFKYGVSDVTVPEGQAFRGWFNATIPTATKVAEGISLTENLNLYAKATEIEVAELGKIYEYDLTKAYFYAEDHELFSHNGGGFHDGQHGWSFSNGNSLSIQVAGNALLAVNVCKYSNAGETVLKDAADNVIGSLVITSETGDGSKQSIYYEGPATTLTLYFTATNYIHSVKVYNIASLPSKDIATGYYIMTPGDGAGLKLVLESLQEGDKIFLPNGIYDFGQDALTQISKNNVSIVGQSMEGTIIRNAPDYHNEGIGTTATILIPDNVTGTYFQDLTLHNAMDYFASLGASGNGRGVALQDKGTKTICKNVCLHSNQDTYYSNKVGALKYFEDGEIHGTVDFICGDGSVYFYGTELICEQRNKDGGGADAVTASNADASDNGYVFDHCTIRYADSIVGTKPVVSFGRAWNNSPKTVFLNTFLDNSNGELNMHKDAGAQKDKIERWTLGAMNALPETFGEYNSVDQNGAVVSPASNNVTFVLGSNEKQMETILTADQAATYTMAYTLGDWAATAAADATQAVCDLENIDASAIYLIEESNGNADLITGSSLMSLVIPEGSGITVRKANARGGFGPKAGEPDPQGVENISDCGCKVEKIIRNGQVVIVRDGKEYNMLGAEMR